jgi:hypothetical protein
MTNTPQDDLLDGVTDYVAFLGFNRRRVFYLLEKGLLPGGKIGRRWIGSKARVRERLAQLTAGEAA